MTFIIPEWRYAGQKPTCTAVMRVTEADFRVDEVLGFEADGEGEHVMLNITKTGENTEYLARQIARLAGVKNMDVSYAGQKDRHAVTTQNFTVYLSNRDEPDWNELATDRIVINSVIRHKKKLRRGALQGNRFVITLRDLKGDLVTLKESLQRIKVSGIPNYFGEQRFGRDNIDRALAMFRGEFRPRKHQRGMYLSAARSLVFNAQLSERIAQKNWQTVLLGDVLMLNGSHSVFVAEELDDTLLSRCEQGELHPTGSMPGRGGKQPLLDALEIEQAVMKGYSEIIAGLDKAGVDAQRRALRVMLGEFEWRLNNSGNNSGNNDDEELVLNFFLPAGSYATSVIRELMLVDNAAINNNAKAGEQTGENTDQTSA